VLLDAFPWGLLFLLHFDNGDFVGDAVWANPGETQKCHRIFSISPSLPSQNGDHGSEGLDDKSRDNGDPSMGVTRGRFKRERSRGKSTRRSKGKESLPSGRGKTCTGLPIEARFEYKSQRRSSIFLRPRSVVVPELMRRGPWSNLSRFSNLNPEECLVVKVSSEWGEDEVKDEVVLGDEWRPEPLRGVRSSIQEMMDVMFKANDRRKGLRFKWVDGPARIPELRYTADMPVIRPGLYSGHYGEHYGQFADEIFLVQYHKFNLDYLRRKNATEKKERIASEKAGLDTWIRIYEEVFDRRGKNEMLEIKCYLEDTNANVDEIIFVTGRKVTGDLHVPMGETTWVALVYPILPLDRQEFESVRGREDGKSLDVMRSFPGWGTLAYPGFEQASFSKGSLVQVANGHHGGHRFGFTWERGQDSTIMEWMDVQDSNPFLSAPHASRGRKRRNAEGLRRTQAKKLLPLGEEKCCIS